MIIHESYSESYYAMTLVFPTSELSDLSVICRFNTNKGLKKSLLQKIIKEATVSGVLISLADLIEPEVSLM